ncbi:MAG: hypothetical protein IPK82_40075 [Polyangiaceae bacterium]|nr:hypothetical protein [Polyangiaceae bacterium]
MFTTVRSPSKNDLREETENNRAAWVGKDLDIVVKQSLRERIEGNSHEHVIGNKNGRIDKSLSLMVLDDTDEEVKGRYGLKSGKALHIVSGETLVGEAQDVTIKSAGGFIRIDSAGVTVVGTVVKINNGGSAGKGLGPTTVDPADPGSYTAAPSDMGSPLVGQGEKVPPATVECEIKTLEMECDHPKRAYKVKLPAASTVKPPVNVIEVVAADKSNAEKIKTTVSLAKPRCSKHKNGVIVKSPHETLAKPDVSTVEVYYGDKDIHGEILPLLWPWKDKPVEYTFTAQACKGLSTPAVVRVYPNVEPQVSFKFELDSDAIDDRTNKRMDVAQSRGYVEKRGRPAQTAWKFEFQGKIKYGSRSVSLGLKLDDKFKKLAWMNLLVKRGIDFFCEVFYKFMGVRLLPIFPKVALQYEGKFKEIDKSYRVGAEWSFLFKADPLFGIKVKFDVLEGIIYAMGLIPQLKPVSTGLLKVKNWAKDKGQTFEIMLTISGEIGGEVGAKKEAAAPKAGVRGAIEGKVKVELMAKASFGSTGYVGFALGAEVGGDTGVVAGLTLGNNDKGIYLKGRFALLECKLKVAAWASGKVIWEVKESYEGEFTLWEEQDFSKGQSWYLLGNA